MPFAPLTDEHHALRREARAFARDRLVDVKPLTEHLPTPEERFLASKPVYEDLVAAGFLKRLIPQPFGGGGTGMLDMAMVAEEFHAVDVNVSLTLFANLLGLMPVFMGGTPEQQSRLVAPFLQTSGAPLAALANSEPGGSANFDAPAPAEGVRSTARRDGNGWIVDARKRWVSSATGWQGEGATLLCTVCRTDPEADPDAALSVLAVEGPIDGLVLERAAQSLGHRAHLTPDFRLDGVRVPDANLLGGEGAGRELVTGSFIGTAALVGVMSVGVMRAAFDWTLDFAKTQKRGGDQPIIEHQAVGYALADAKTALDAARALALRACAAEDGGHPGAMELALQSKVFGSETAVRVLTDLMRVVGCDSYDLELTPLAGWLRDALAFPVFDGGNMGVRRRQMHNLMMSPDYDPLATV